jgi:hypothetical protein
MAELTILACVLAACVFGASAAAKLGGRRRYRDYAAGLGQTGLLPGRLLPVAAALLAAGEAAVAAAVATAAGWLAAADQAAARPAIAALAAATVLTAVLAAGVAVTLRRGVAARCACFGASTGRPLGRIHLARNLALLAATGAGTVAAALAPPRPSPAAVVLAATAGCVLALLFVRWEDLAEVLGPAPRAAAPANRVRAGRP